jgi:predicted DNA-binding transcriptional regulator YafY
MSQLERLFRIDQMLQGAKVVTFGTMLKTLEISKATLKRDLAYMRDRMNVPIVYDHFDRGYKLENTGNKNRSQLPGLWFSAPEIRALLMMHKLLSDLDSGGLLGPYIEPLLDRIRATMQTDVSDVEATLHRVKVVLANQHRPVDAKAFQTIGTALFMSKRLEFEYFSRHANTQDLRQVSPQRLLYYRDNWYLVAHCHLRNDLRVFALDAMRDILMLEKAIKQLSDAKLSAALDEGFGIYNGGPVQWATLHFTSESARWLQHETWHPKQKSKKLANGGLQIELPYLSSTELVRDIMRLGSHVKVIQPPSLAAEVKAQLTQALQQYAQ